MLSQQKIQSTKSAWLCKIATCAGVKVNLEHVFQAIRVYKLLEHDNTIQHLHMPGARGIAYAVLNFR